MADERLWRKEILLQKLNIETAPIDLASIVPATTLVMPCDRKAGWIEENAKAGVIIRDKGGKFRIRTGHVYGLSGSHSATKIIIWSDQAVNDLADEADDIYKMSLFMNDPSLFRIDEITLMCDGHVLRQWFKNIFGPHDLVQIQRLLKQNDLGAAQERKDRIARNRALMPKIRAASWWRSQNKSPHPAFGDNPLTLEPAV
jgi:hypothetical protein